MYDSYVLVKLNVDIQIYERVHFLFMDNHKSKIKFTTKFVVSIFPELCLNCKVDQLIYLEYL